MYLDSHITPLILAITNKNQHAVDLLLARDDLDVNLRVDYVIILIQFKAIIWVKFYLKFQAPAIIYAIQERNLEMIKSLLNRHDIDLNIKGILNTILKLCFDLRNSIQF